MFGKVSKVRPGRAGPIRALDPTRVVEDVFCLDFRGPIAPLEAFAIAPAAYRALTWADCLLAFSDKLVDGLEVSWPCALQQDSCLGEEASCELIPVTSN